MHPRSWEGLLGILTAPLLHAGWDHLLGNSLPLLVLGLLLFTSYKDIAMQVFLLIYFLHGILLWCLANPGYHLGASGMIYGIASFLFFSGLVRKNPPLAVISFLVVFLYGYMVHGIFPIYPHISWEGHLYGALTGMMLAFVLRKDGPQAKKYFQDEEEEEQRIAEHQEEQLPVPPPTYIPSDPLFPQQGWIQWEWKQDHTDSVRKSEDNTPEKDEKKDE
jgi:membrane associated rhomboid family serine protease